MSKGWVDFRTIKTSVAMGQILARYGTALKPSGIGHLRGPCPLPTHTSDKTRLSFIVNAGKNVWACQSASCVKARGGKIGGNNLDFVAAMERCSIYQAALYLQEWFGVPDSQTSGGDGHGIKTGSNNLPSAIAENKPLSFALSGLDFQHPYFLQRKVACETARYFGAGFYAGPGTMTGRLAIPIHDRRGELVAYAGRSIDASLPKYRFPAGFRKSQELYNLHRVLTSAHGGRVIVVEGFFDCWKIYQAGFRNVVTLMGCALSRVQAELLENYFNEVILLLDGDLAGRTASATIGDQLGRRLRVHVGQVPTDRQPDELSAVEISALLAPYQRGDISASPKGGREFSVQATEPVQMRGLRCRSG